MSPPFEASIAFQTNRTPAEYEALGELVERYHFDVVSVYNDLFFQPALGPLLCLARTVRRARLGPAALNPYTLHPIEIAGQIAVLDQASQGRAYLGLARGSWLDDLGVATDQPVTRLREAIAVVRYLLAGRRDGFRGDVFRIAADVSFHFNVRRPVVPIMVGTWGARTTRMAGEVADEVKVGGSANWRMVPLIRERLGNERVGICLGAVTVVDRDRQAARALARREVAPYVAVVAGLDTTIDDTEWLDRMRRHAASNDYEGIAADLSDDMLDHFAFSGTPDDILGQVAALRAAGATRVEFGTPHGLDPPTGVGLLGAQVLPRLER